jgi:hypothetical protein
MLSTVVCVVLLVTVSGAFIAAERAKTELTPIYAIKIDKEFSPVCVLSICHKRSADLVFKLRGRRHQLQVWIDRGLRRVLTIYPTRRHRDGTVRLLFKGRNKHGSVLRDGLYTPVIRVDSRTFTLPDRIDLVTKPPRVVAAPDHFQAILSPARRTVRIGYKLSEHAHGILLVNGRQVEFTRFQPLRGVLRWNGEFGTNALPPGRYRIAIAAQDAAGNRSRPREIGVITIQHRQNEPLVDSGLAN